MIWLQHGETRAYDAVFRVLDGKDAIADAEGRISAIARQPEQDYPQPSGDFPKLAGRA